MQKNFTLSVLNIIQPKFLRPAALSQKRLIAFLKPAKSALTVF